MDSGLSIATGIALLFGGSGLLGCVWWIVSSIFKLRARLVALEAEVRGIQMRCCRRERWLESMDATLARVDKNVVKLAASLNVEIDET